MESKIKFAIIGCGHIGKRHAKMVIHNSSCELIAICDIASKKDLDLGKLYDFPFFNTIDELIDSNLAFDVACICTPNGLHAAQSIQLLKDMVKFKGKLNQFQMADIKKLLALLKKIK